MCVCVRVRLCVYAHARLEGLPGTVGGGGWIWYGPFCIISLFGWGGGFNILQTGGARFRWWAGRSCSE